MMRQGNALSVGQAGNPACAAAQMGLHVRAGANIGGGGGYAVTDSIVIMDPAHRLRPSHGAKGFNRHWSRWGSARQVPIPMRRGIPFRGDTLGAGYTTFSAPG